MLQPEEADALKPLDADDKEDSQLAKAIQMSLKDQEERELLCRDYGEDNESNFQKVLEMSLHEDHSETSELFMWFLKHFIYSKIPIIRPPLGLFKSSLKEHF